MDYDIARKGLPSELVFAVPRTHVPRGLENLRERYRLKQSARFAFRFGTRYEGRPWLEIEKYSDGQEDEARYKERLDVLSMHCAISHSAISTSP